MILTEQPKDLREEVREACEICGSMDWQTLTDMGAAEPAAARMMCGQCGNVRPYARDVLPE